MEVMCSRLIWIRLPLGSVNLIQTIVLPAILRRNGTLCARAGSDAANEAVFSVANGSATSSTPGVGRVNLDSRPGYWRPPKRPRQCQKRVGRPVSWRPCEALLFSLLKARSANETASGLKPIANPICVAEDAGGSPIRDLRLL